MSKHNSSGSYRHKIQRIASDHYRLYWTVDRSVSGSRLRFPTTTSRDTDEAGAARFAKRWNLDIFPTPPEKA
jgi:hypothetical protein